MSARAAPTPAEAAFADAYRALGETGADRAAAFDAFAASGLPHRRIEGWRWSDLRAALAHPLVRAARAAPQAVRLLGALEAHRLTVVNGWLAAPLADAPGLDVRGADAHFPASDAGGPAAALARALADEPIEIVVAPGVALDRPLLVRHVATGARSFHHERLRLVVGAGARLTVVELFEADAADGYANTLLELDIEDGAELERVIVQSAREDATLTATVAARLGRGAKLHQTSLAFGGRLVRLETQVAEAGEGAEITLDGAYLLDGRRHADQTTVVRHDALAATTRELFKGAVKDHATGVFQGKIVVGRGAQKTDARMGHHALLLSEGASVNAKPELEIYADDVQCAHGATAGALDPEQIFYLEARGLPEARAKALVTEAFIAEAFARVSDAGLRETLLEQARAWLERAIA